MTTNENHEKSLADHLLKSPYRGAAPPQASELLSPSKAYGPVREVHDCDWDGALDLEAEEDED